MFELEYEELHAGDSTATYSVKFDNAIMPTVAEFISHVVNNRQQEWGDITVFCRNRFKNIYNRRRLEYMHGKVQKDDIPECAKQMKIMAVDADGGYSRMNYSIEVAEFVIKEPKETLPNIEMNRSVLLYALRAFKESNYFPHIDTKVLDDVCSDLIALIKNNVSEITLCAGNPFICIRQALRNRIPQVEGQEQTYCKLAVDQLEQFEELNNQIKEQHIGRNVPKHIISIVLKDNDVVFD